VVIAVFVVMAGVITYLLLNRPNPQQLVLVITATPNPISVIVPTSIPTLVPTAVPTNILPTATLQPTPTLKPYYLANEATYLREGISIYLEPDFKSEGFVGCDTPKPGFVVALQIANNNDVNFTARFDAFGFSAVDNTGKTYKLVASGFYFCSIDPGIRSSDLAPGSNAEYQVILAFSGQIPLEATQIFITINSISGSPTLVFRKDL
jgi:hypothetical protein